MIKLVDLGSTILEVYLIYADENADRIITYIIVKHAV
jgi:hypothetical protein